MGELVQVFKPWHPIDIKFQRRIHAAAGGDAS